MVSNGHFPQLNHIIQYMETYKERNASRSSTDFLADIPVPGQPLPPSMPLDYVEDKNAPEDDGSDILAMAQGIDGDDNGNDGEGDEDGATPLDQDEDGTVNEDNEQDDDDDLDKLTEIKKPIAIPSKKAAATASDRPLTEKEIKKARKQEAKQGRIDARRAAKVAKRENAANEDASQGVDRSSRRQTFLFSATLMLPGEGRESSSSKRKLKKRNGPESSMLDELADRMTFREDPLVIDLGTKQTVAEGLEEKRVDCIDGDKVPSSLPRSNTVSCWYGIIMVMTLMMILDRITICIISYRVVPVKHWYL
jgi:hypothetical protein